MSDKGYPEPDKTSVFYQITQLCDTVYVDAFNKGWHDIKRSPAEIHMLIVTEIAEATEEVRKGSKPFIYVKDEKHGAKPVGELTELADAVIRIMDYCGSNGWDLGEAIEQKLIYNKRRSYRHGGKLL